MPRITVVGSINMDIVNAVNHHPLPGETIQGMGTSYSAGGKGANQAVAAARAGGDVTFVGAVGKDAFGEALVSGLTEHGVKTGCVVRKAGASGLAFINVDARGQNTIVLSAGANGQLSQDDVERSLHAIEGSDALLLQNEVPWETTAFAIREAHKRGVRVWLNPAPVGRLTSEQLASVDVLALNETEIETMTGHAVSTDESTDRAVARILSAGVGEVILTLGSSGCRYFSKEGLIYHVPAFTVNTVDTTAAGDAFIGAYAVAVTSGYEIKAALRFATAAAAIAVTRNGAQSSIPLRKDVQVFLAERE